jgi:hypothetical protein
MSAHELARIETRQELCEPRPRPGHSIQAAAAADGADVDTFWREGLPPYPRRVDQAIVHGGAEKNERNFPHVDDFAHFTVGVDTPGADASEPVDDKRRNLRADGRHGPLHENRTVTDRHPGQTVRPVRAEAHNTTEGRRFFEMDDLSTLATNRSSILPIRVHLHS